MKHTFQRTMGYGDIYVEITSNADDAHAPKLIETVVKAIDIKFTNMLYGFEPTVASDVMTNFGAEVKSPGHLYPYRIHVWGKIARHLPIEDPVSGESTPNTSGDISETLQVTLPAHKQLVEIIYGRRQAINAAAHEFADAFTEYWQSNNEAHATLVRKFEDIFRSNPDADFTMADVYNAPAFKRMRASLGIPESEKTPKGPLDNLNIGQVMRVGKKVGEIIEDLFKPKPPSDPDK